MSTNNTQYFQKAIDVLMNENIDYKKVCIALAQTNPKLFIKLVENPNVFMKIKDWHREVKHHIHAGYKVEAIKLIRGKTGFGLKEAKDIADCLQNYWASKGYCNPYQYSTDKSSMNSEQKEVYNLITRA